MTRDRLEELLSQFATRRVAVLGDYFLDRYLEFDPELAELSLETGKTANQVVNVRHSPGAAGNVVCNLRALGCGTIMTLGFCGDDGEGYELRQDLSALGCDTAHFRVASELRTPVYCKPRDIRVPGLRGESERYDTKNREATPQWVEEKLMASLEAVLGEVEALIVVDQVDEDNCGALTDRVRALVTELAPAHPQVVIWADSRRRAAHYPGVTIKPNQQEAVAAAFPDHKGEATDEVVAEAGRFLTRRSHRPVFITRAERGLMVFDRDGCEAVEAVKVEGPIDPTGAGDSVTAAAVLTLASGGNPGEAALIANLVASITIEQIGRTGTATPEQLLERWERWRAQG